MRSVWGSQKVQEDAAASVECAYTGPARGGQAPEPPPQPLGSGAPTTSIRKRRAQKAPENCSHCLPVQKRRRLIRKTPPEISGFPHAWRAGRTDALETRDFVPYFFVSIYSKSKWMTGQVAQCPEHSSDAPGSCLCIIVKVVKSQAHVLQAGIGPAKFPVKALKALAPRNSKFPNEPYVDVSFHRENGLATLTTNTGQFVTASIPWLLHNGQGAAPGIRSARVQLQPEQVAARVQASTAWPLAARTEAGPDSAPCPSVAPGPPPPSVHQMTGHTSRHRAQRVHRPSL